MPRRPWGPCRAQQDHSVAASPRPCILPARKCKCTGAPAHCELCVDDLKAHCGPGASREWCSQDFLKRQIEASGSRGGTGTLPTACLHHRNLTLHWASTQSKKNALLAARLCGTLLPSPAARVEACLGLSHPLRESCFLEHLAGSRPRPQKVEAQVACLGPDEPQVVIGRWLRKGWLNR